MKNYWLISLLLAGLLSITGFTFWGEGPGIEEVFKLNTPQVKWNALAYDSQEKNFYLGGLNKGKIIRVDKKGNASEFKAEGEDGLMAITALAADVKKRILWVGVADIPEWEGSTDLGRAMIFKYSLESGNLLRKYEAPEDSLPHRFNEISFNSQGTVFFTDTQANQVLMIQQGTMRKIELLVESPEMKALTGLANTSNDKELFITDRNSGLFRVKFQDGRLLLLENKSGQNITGNVQLFTSGSNLFGLFQQEGELKMASFEIKKTNIEAVKWLDRSLNTLKDTGKGVVDGSDLFLLSGAGSFTPAVIKVKL